MNIDEVNKVANSRIRKYDWSTQDIDNGVRLTVTDGRQNASVDITTGENIQSEIDRLITEVDNHNYRVLS